jgi:hypothetical protein
MNVRKQPTPPSFQRRWLGLSAGAVVVMFLVVYWCWPTPQLGADEEVLRTVDALFTAITGRNEPALVQCQQRLHSYRDSGKLTPSAADTLDAVIAQSRAGGWQPAASRLYAFILAQRGEPSKRRA